MCQNCNETSHATRTIGQLTFGDIVGLEPIVPIETPAILPRLPDVTDCDDCEDEAEVIECENCSCDVGDDSYTDDSGDVYCEECYHEMYSSCESCGDVVPADDIKQVSVRVWRNGRRQSIDSCLCESCFDRDYFTCADCNGTSPDDVGGTNCDGDRVCESCSEDYSYCESCSSTIHNDNSNYNERTGCTECDDCYSPGGDGDKTEFDAKRFRRPNDIATRCGSLRSYGVELETSVCDGHTDLEGRVYFGACEDGSIDGMEFVSSVLSGDAGLKAIDDFCDQADGFETDNKCGFHAHIGIADLTDSQRLSVCMAYALSADVWRSFVSETRRRNTYCGANKWSADDVASAGSFEALAAAQTDRYQWVNLQAYSRHKTVEIRLHGATLESDKICNWVVAHVRFIDVVSKMTFAQLRKLFAGTDSDKFAALAAMWPADVATFYHERAAKFGTEYATPAADVASRKPRARAARRLRGVARAIA